MNTTSDNAIAYFQYLYGAGPAMFQFARMQIEAPWLMFELQLPQLKALRDFLAKAISYHEQPEQLIAFEDGRLLVSSTKSTCKLSAETTRAGSLTHTFATREYAPMLYAVLGILHRIVPPDTTDLEVDERIAKYRRGESPTGIP